MTDFSVFEKFNEQFDIAGLQEDIEAASKPFERVEVPAGDYEVAVDNVEVAATQDGRPKVSIWFKIINGEYKGQRLFYNQTIDEGWKIRRCNEFLESLESGEDIGFADFVQYADLLESVKQAIASEEYQLAYTKNERGYGIFNIVQKFPKD